jgi:chromosomal replication initiation ATPase DnaA
VNDTSAPDLASLIAQLEAVELQLMEIDADELSRDERNQLAEQLDDCSTNLMRLRNADLANLAEAFKLREPELFRAAARLERDLRELEGAAEIIDTVSLAMDTITDIVKLLA